MPHCPNPANWPNYVAMGIPLGMAAVFVAWSVLKEMFGEYTGPRD